MCIIIYSPTGKIPKKQLTRSLTVNPDGWGFMFARNGQLIVRKGMASRHFWKAWREEAPTGPVVFHARIGTQGTRSEKNCHPFHVPNHEGVAVCHNGIIRQHCEKDSPANDTQLFNWEILAQLPPNFLDNEGIAALIADYVGYSKLVFMDANGRVDIINERFGLWSNGRWYSNKSYLPPVPPVIQVPATVNRLLNETRPFWEVPKGGYKK